MPGTLEGRPPNQAPGPMLSHHQDQFAEVSESRRGALVVGAGPAGLFAALALAAAGVEDIVVVDAGPDIDRRCAAVDFSRALGTGDPGYERGVGGAGLFSDGKLCLSLDVGGHLESSVDGARRADLLEQIAAVFSAVVAENVWTVRGEEGDLRDSEAQAQASGLGFKHYPVAHIGTDRCRDVIAELRSILARAGINFAAETELVDLAVDGDDKVASLRHEAEIYRLRTAHLVLAMGKVGADQQVEICRRLGIGTTSQPIYVGVRFETDAEILAPLFSATKDPKYSAILADGSKVKTHCASEGGEVIELRYAGLPLAGGHNYSYAETNRSGFSILWNGLGTGGESSYRAALDIMRRAAQAGHGGLVAQRFIDYQAGRRTSQAALAGIDLTCAAAAPSDLREVLPPEFFAAMDIFTARLESLIPGFIDDRSVAYAPAIEWWMDRVVVDEHFGVPEIPGLAICGDGSGWSQGIVHAAATGLLAAEGLTGETAEVGRWIGSTPAPLVLG